MKTLIKKDIKIVGPLINMILIPMGLVFAFGIVLIDDKFIRILLSSFSIFMMANMALLKMWSHDFSKKTDIFLNSLPLDKELIVTSRYASIMIYIACSSLIVFIVSQSHRGMFINDPINTIDLNEIINIISVSILLMASYLPIYYTKSRKFNNVSELPLFIGLVAIVIIRHSYNNKNVFYRIINNIDLSQISVILIILSIIAYTLSLKASIKLYKSQEF